MAPCSELQKVVSKNFDFRKILKIHKKIVNPQNNNIDLSERNFKVELEDGCEVS